MGSAAGDAGLLERLRRQLARERLDLACELALLNGQYLDASGESAEREQRRGQLPVVTALRTDRREPAQELRAGQRAEFRALWRGAEPQPRGGGFGAAFFEWRSASQRSVISAIIPCATCGGPPLRLLTKHSRAYLPGLSRASSVICFVPPAILAV